MFNKTSHFAVISAVVGLFIFFAGLVWLGLSREDKKTTPPISSPVATTTPRVVSLEEDIQWGVQFSQGATGTLYLCVVAQSKNGFAFGNAGVQCADVYKKKTEEYEGVARESAATIFKNIQNAVKLNEDMTSKSIDIANKLNNLTK